MNTFILLVVCFWLPLSALLAPFIGRCIRWGGR